MAERARRPFWLHQLIEYLIGLGIIAQGLQDPQPVVPLVVGLTIVVNTSLARGPLGAFRLVDRRLHRWLDVAVGLFALTSAAQPWVGVEPITRLLLIGALVPLGVSWWYTDWAKREARAARRAAAVGPRGEQLGRAAGRAAGSMWARGRRALDQPAE